MPAFAAARTSSALRAASAGAPSTLTRMSFAFCAVIVARSATNENASPSPAMPVISSVTKPRCVASMASSSARRTAFWWSSAAYCTWFATAPRDISEASAPCAMASATQAAVAPTCACEAARKRSVSSAARRASISSPAMLSAPFAGPPAEAARTRWPSVPCAPSSAMTCSESLRAWTPCARSSCASVGALARVRIEASDVVCHDRRRDGLRADTRRHREEAARDAVDLGARVREADRVEEGDRATDVVDLGETGRGGVEA